MTSSSSLLHSVTSDMAIYNIQASLVAQLLKNPLGNAGDTGDVVLIPGLGRSPGEGNGNPLQSVFLPAEFHGQRSLVGHSLWGCRVGHN